MWLKTNCAVITDIYEYWTDTLSIWISVWRWMFSTTHNILLYVKKYTLWTELICDLLSFLLFKPEFYHDTFCTELCCTYGYIKNDLKFISELYETARNDRSSFRSGFFWSTIELCISNIASVLLLMMLTESICESSNISGVLLNNL